MKPSIGRIVHYFVREWDSEHPEGVVNPYPGIITKVHEDDSVDLAAFGGPEHGLVVTGIAFGDGEPRTWIWPPRV